MNCAKKDMATLKGVKKNWTRDPETKRAKVLETATHLFATKGYRDVTTLEIAGGAGISEPLLFHYFGSKSRLAGEIAQSFANGLIQSMWSRVDQEAPPDIDHIVTDIFAYVRDRGMLMTLFANLGMPESDPSYRSVIVQELSGRFGMWKNQGFLRDVHPERAAVMAYAIVDAGLRADQGLDQDCADAPQADVWIAETSRALRALLDL